jgi:hypothetical protein
MLTEKFREDWSKAIAFIAGGQKSRVMINEKIIKFCNKP